MLIASKHKRPTAPITIDGKVYFFTPIDPSHSDSEHVADIQDAEHIQKFLCVPEGYYISEAKSLPVLPPRPIVKALKASSVASIGSDPTAPANASLGSSVAEQPTPEQTEAAQALISMSWQKLKTVAEGTDATVLALALSIERAKPEIEQRETVLKILAKALEG